ncbi:MAG: hypothetical protein EXR95_02825 [Gemmatimonadetes bacterium]|nr:hypothetical protein [Gemmatimonadota bacterium]
MRRQSDLGPILAIALGAFVSLGATGVAVGFWQTIRLSEPLMASARLQAALETVEGAGESEVGACNAGFHVRADPSDWAVVGDYDGVVRLGPNGLVVELAHGSALAADEDAQVRGIVFGVAQESEGGAWSLTHSSAPLPVGALERGVPRPVRPARVLIPGVGTEELAHGWLVVEHVLDAPEVEGGDGLDLSPRRAVHAPPPPRPRLRAALIV